MWPWNQCQGRTRIKLRSIYSSYCHFLSESFHIWQNDSLWCVVCLIWSFSSQLIFFQSSHVRMTHSLVELALSRILCVLPIISCSLVVTCWARADLLAPLYVMFSCVLSPFHTIPCPGSCVVLDCIDSWPLPSSFFAQGQYAVPPVRLKPATPLYRLKHSTTGYCTRILCGDHDESFRLLLWPWSKMSRSNMSYKCWRAFLFHFC